MLGLTSGDLLGWSYVTTTVDSQTQTRSSSETSYLREALAETMNLEVYKTTVAKQVLFDSTKRATGVRVDSGGYEYEISAKEEVIVSAGAVSLNLRVSTILKQELSMLVSFPTTPHGIWHWTQSNLRAAQYPRLIRSTWGRPEYVCMSAKL